MRWTDAIRPGGGRATNPCKRDQGETASALISGPSGRTFAGGQTATPGGVQPQITTRRRWRIASRTPGRTWTRSPPATSKAGVAKQQATLRRTGSGPPAGAGVQANDRSRLTQRPVAPESHIPSPMTVGAVARAASMRPAAWRKPSNRTMSDTPISAAMTPPSSHWNPWCLSRSSGGRASFDPPCLDCCSLGGADNRRGSLRLCPAVRFGC
jgi:hypothetical protein